MNLLMLASAVVSTNIQVVVTASPIAKEEVFEKDGAEVTIVGAEQISRLSAQDLPTALRNVPGVSVSRYSPIGAYGGAQGGSVYIRGTGESRPGGSLTIFQDGVPTVGSFFSHPLMDLTPIDFSEEIKVTKSPRPRTVPNAFTAVEMTTFRQREEGHQGELDLVYGRFSTAIGSFKFGAKEGAFDFAAGVAYRYSKGARAHNKAELGNAFARGGVDFGETEYLSVIYHRADSEVEDPGEKGMPTPKRDTFETAMNSVTARLESNRDYLKGSSQVYFMDGRIRWHKDHIVDANPNSPYGMLKTDWLSYGYRSLYDIISGDWTISAGFDEMIEEGKTRTINERDRRVTFRSGTKRQYLTSPYVGARYDFHLGDDWILTPSLGSRYHFVNDLRGEWAPSAALTIGREEFSFFASYARAAHFPGLIFRANTTAWEDLKAETMDTFTIGFKAKYEDVVSLHCSAFHNEIKNRFDLDAAGQYHNASSMRAYGFETIARLFPEDDLNFYCGATFAIPKTEPVARLPKATLAVGASWTFLDHFHFDIDSEYVSSMYAYTVRSADPADLAEVDAFWTLNLRFAIDLKAVSPLDGQIFFSCENVCDRRYEYFPGYEMPGAMFYTGVKWRF